MNLQIDEIRITRGEFQVLPPEALGAEEDSEQTQASLLVGCEFALVDAKGVAIATGTATNGQNTAAANARLSSGTLEAFNNFFRLLEHDIANSLATGTPSVAGDPKEDDGLEGIMARALARDS